MNCAILLAAALIAAEPHPDPLREVMLADYAQFGSADAGYIRYIRWDAVELSEAQIDTLHAFWLPHLSRERVLQHQLPVKVVERLYRIDLRGLGWDLAAWRKLSLEYPYRCPPHENILHVRGDWLVAITSDTTQSQLYYDLLYGSGKAPKNRDEFFKFWRADAVENRDPQAYVIQTGKSGVAHGERLMLVYPDGSSETFDSEEAVGEQSPLETIGGQLKFDAQELIAPIPKVDIVTGERSFAQAYLLTDGQRNKQDEASTKVVVDTTSKTGIVLTPGSCVRCHTTGLLKPEHNLVRELFRNGNELYFKRKQLSLDVQAQYLGLLDKRLKRAGEDFSALVAAVPKLTITKCVSEYTALLKAYHGNVTLEQAARELYTTPRTLQLAVAYYFEKQGPQLKAAQLAVLAQGQGQTIPREAWEQYVFGQAFEALCVWKEKP